MPDNSTLNKKTKNYSPIPKITVLMNPQWGTKATSGVSILCCCFHWSVSVNTAHGILLDPLLQRLKWCSAGPTLRSRSLPVWIPSRICVRCFSSPGWWMRKVSVSNYYSICQLVRALLLVNFAGRRNFYRTARKIWKLAFSLRLINLRYIMVILLISTLELC